MYVTTVKNVKIKSHVTQGCTNSDLILIVSMHLLTDFIPHPSLIPEIYCLGPLNTKISQQ